MKKHTLVPISLLLVFSSCLLNACSGKTTSLVTETVENYLKAKTAQEAYDIIDYRSGNEDQQNFSLEWDNIASFYFKVYAADNPDFIDPTVRFTADLGISGGSFIPGKHYYVRVYTVETSEEFDEVLETSPGDSYFNLPDKDPVAECEFTAKSNTVRWIDVGGIDNVRDLGGWKAGKKRIKYGLLYRGGSPNGVDTSGRVTMKCDLKIRSEIDLRTPGSDNGDITCCPWDGSVNFLQAPITGYSYIYPSFTDNVPAYNISRSYDTRTKKSLFSAFSLLADESNYPVYYHCNGGADRTGTMSFLVLGLLGVDIKDITRDFELTSFSKYGLRFRNSVFTDGEEYGKMQDDNYNFVDWGGLYNTMMNEYSEGKSLSHAIENYLATVIGVSEETVNNIRSILLG